MNAETNTDTLDAVQDVIAKMEDPTITAPRLTAKQTRTILSRLDNHVQKQMRELGLYQSIAGRAFRSGLNAFLNRSVQPAAAALHIEMGKDADTGASLFTVGLDRTAFGASINPMDTGGYDLDPDNSAERHTRIYDRPFLLVSSQKFPAGTEDLPEADLLTMSMVPNGMANLEGQAQQIVANSPDRGLITFYQAFVTYFINALWTSDKLRKNLKARTFLPHVRHYQLEPTDRQIRFVFDIGTRVQEDGMVEKTIGMGEDVKVEMVPGKVWRFTGECERITVCIDPLQMFQSSRIDQWYPQLYAAQDAAAEAAAQQAAEALVEKQNGDTSAPIDVSEIVGNDDVELTLEDAVLLPLGRPTLAGRIYPPELLEAQLAEGGQLHGLIERDTVYGEFDVPRNPVGSTGQQWAARVAEVKLDRVALKVENIRVNEARDALIGKVIPFGPLAPALRELIARKAPVAFAMRSFTVEDGENPKRVKELRAVVAFDLVGNTSTPELLEEIRQSLPEGAVIPTDPSGQPYSYGTHLADPETGVMERRPDLDNPVPVEPIKVADATQVEAFDGQSK